MPCTYVLWSAKLREYHIGFTAEDPTAELARHNKKHKGFTNAGRPWELKASREFPALAQAHSLAFGLQKSTGRKSLRTFIRQNPWPPQKATTEVTEHTEKTVSEKQV